MLYSALLNDLLPLVNVRHRNPLHIFILGPKKDMVSFYKTPERMFREISYFDLFSWWRIFLNVKQSIHFHFDSFSIYSVTWTSHAFIHFDNLSILLDVYRSCRDLSHLVLNILRFWNCITYVV